MRPIIGIPCLAAERAKTHRPLYGNNQSYVRAVAQSGGIPVLIPPQAEAASLDHVCARLDGLLLTGGEDVAPALYGEAPLPKCGQPEPERDDLEMRMTRWALEYDLPIFGICRGMQLLNVAAGGTLYQDLATQLPGTAEHALSALPRDTRAHEIAVQADSRLARILGTERPQVNSLHHQAVARPGADVEILAVSPDGVAEAMEVRGQSFALAVQYHPEELFDSDEASQRLFAAFIAACEERSTAHEGRTTTP